MGRVSSESANPIKHTSPKGYATQSHFSDASQRAAPLHCSSMLRCKAHTILPILHRKCFVRLYRTRTTCAGCCASACTVPLDWDRPWQVSLSILNLPECRSQHSRVTTKVYGRLLGLLASHSSIKRRSDGFEPSAAGVASRNSVWRPWRILSRLGIYCFPFSLRLAHFIIRRQGDGS
jgi:hypothetical protein